MPILQAVLFDFDGTLVDSAPDIRQALNLTLQAHDRRAMTLDEVKALVGDGLLTTVHRAFAVTGTPIDESESYVRFQQFITHYRNQKPDPTQIYPHTLETIDALQNAGIKLGVCTNKQEAATLRLLEQLDLARYFTAVAGGDTFMVHKPNPGHITGLLEKMQVPAAQTVMVGDSLNDVRAAHGAYMPCIVVTHGYGVGLEEIGADALISGFPELSPTLAKLGFTTA